MLYNKYKYLLVPLATSLLAVGTASADQLCDLSDGFAPTPIGFSQEAEACLEGVDGLNVQSYLESEIRRQTLALREARGEGTSNLASLNEAARLHAFDMAARGFIAHDDPEGRGHIDRIRILERQRLVGATGANIVVVSANSSPQEVFEAIMSDPENARNAKRSSFTHMGVGAVESGGRIYVVQLFARVDGAIDQPVPIKLNKRTDLRVSYENPKIRTVDWRLEDGSGATLLRGTGPQIMDPPDAIAAGGLRFNVALGSDTYVLAGPAVMTQ